MEEFKPKCHKCGTRATLVHDMYDTRSLQRRMPPSICFQCWLDNGWKKMKLSQLANLFIWWIIFLPLFTFFAWLAYVFLFAPQQKVHAPDLVIYLPLIVSLGLIPYFACSLWLMSRYGPLLELISGFRRFIMEVLPGFLWFMTTIAAFFAFIYIRDGNISIKW